MVVLVEKTSLDGGVNSWSEALKTVEKPYDFDKIISGEYGVGGYGCLCGDIENFIFSKMGINLSNMKLHDMRLKDVKVGKTASVIKVHGEGPVRRRIMDMGITKGVEIYVRKVAPLGDPIEVTLRGYELTLRKSEANLVILELGGKK